MRIKKFISILILFIIGCSTNEKSKECTTFLECLDGTYVREFLDPLDS